MESNKIISFKSELDKTSTPKWKRSLEKFALAALGSIPWVGGFVAAAASIKIDERNVKREQLQSQWLEEHEKKMKKLVETIQSIILRFQNLGDQVNERIESEEYLELVRKAFRAWDNADTDEKRKYVSNLIGNTAGTRLCSDDVVRLFIDWLNLYHESHFAVIREIYNNPGTTRYEIWMSIYSQEVREDSAEADLYKMLIRDLSMGGVIRQVRATTYDGQFLKKTPTKSGFKSSTMESAFENTKQYELTELGKQFVHYTMNEVVSRIE